MGMPVVCEHAIAYAIAYFAKISATVQPVIGGTDCTPKYSLSLSFPVRGAGHRPNPCQEVPEASWVRVELSSQPQMSQYLHC